jgi:LmbE family N-acetylglucosaminyl deacetylase
VPPKPKRALLLVSHPDDEVFFAASTLIKSTYTFDIVCMTQTTDTMRGSLFEESCRTLERLGASLNQCTLLGMGDPADNPVPPVWWFQRARTALLEQITPHHYEHVLTHNRMGEYGHPHHVTANSVARSIHTRVWEFTHLLPSGVGTQWRGVSTRTFTAPELKEEALAAYAPEFAAFQAHYPDLGDYIAAGSESITGNLGYFL